MHSELLRFGALSIVRESKTTSIWRILSNWLLTRHNTNHRCGSIMLTTHFMSGLMAQSSYRISSTTSGLPSSLLWKYSQTVQFLFYVFWSSGKRRHWPPKFTKNPPTLSDISTSNLTIHHMWKEVYFTVFTIELTPYAKNYKICLMKLVAWDVIFSSAVIPMVSLTRSLIPRVEIIWTKKKSLWSLRIFHMWKLFQRQKFKRTGNRYNIRTIFKTKTLNTLLRLHSWKPGLKKICNRQHSASIAFPVNVA
jgi:hypothetical protein